MPEEHSRVLTDHAADLLLVPTDTAMGHLADAGLSERAVLVGDVMTDVLLAVRARVDDRVGDIAARNDLEIGGYYLATIHRAENTDDPDRLRAILDSLAKLDRPVIPVAHPRLLARDGSAGIDLSAGRLRHRPPLAYADLIAAALGSAGVVTDSGGLQKEAFLLGIPCTTVRTETESMETVDLGWNVLTPDPAGIASAVQRLHPVATDAAPYGDGHVAQRVVEALTGAS